MPIETPMTTPLHSFRRVTRSLALVLLLPLATTLCSIRAAAQRSVDFSLAYTQERTKFVGSGTDPYFMLRGADVEVGYDFHKGVGMAVSGTGLATVNLRGSLDVEQITLQAGPRYTWNWGHITPTVSTRKGGAFLEAQAGYTFATSGAYPVNGVLLDHASALTYMGGGGVNVHVYQRFDLRPIEIDYTRTQLPNGGTNVQNNLRVLAGINWHFGL